MKFLVIVTPRQTPLPPDAIADRLSAQKDWVKQRQADGTIESIYGFVGGGGIGIANVDSPEHMHELMVNSPAFFLSDFEARPIGEFATTIDAAIAALRQAAARMAGPPG
jgi:hypothetical protein